MRIFIFYLPNQAISKYEKSYAPKYGFCHSYISNNNNISEHKGRV